MFSHCELFWIEHISPRTQISWWAAKQQKQEYSGPIRNDSMTLFKTHVDEFAQPSSTPVCPALSRTVDRQ